MNNKKLKRKNVIPYEKFLRDVFKEYDIILKNDEIKEAYDIIKMRRFFSEEFFKARFNLFVCEIFSDRGY